MVSPDGWYPMAMSDRALDSGAAHAAAAVSSRAATHAIGTTFSVILTLSFCHLLNDMMQSLVPAIYPTLKSSYGLSFSQVGLITLAFQCTASLLQPLVGLYTDRRPQPYSLTAGISLTMVGLLLMSRASTYPAILLAAMLIGMGSSIFHPEASRVARMAAGGRYGLAQSLFQVGGNIGSASGPLLAAFVVVPHGQSSIAWFSGTALIAIFVLLLVGGWYARNRTPARPGPRTPAAVVVSATTPRQRMLPRWKVIQAVAILVACSSPRTCTAPAWARTSPSI
jgi:FSR family fosmidomycin resistance protein-like MFS transporter